MKSKRAPSKSAIASKAMKKASRELDRLLEGCRLRRMRKLREIGEQYGLSAAAVEHIIDQERRS